MAISAGRLLAAIDLWMQAHKDQGIGGTLRRERLLVMKDFAQVVGNHYLVSITDDHVRKYLAVNKDVWSPAKRKKVMLVLAEFFFWAYRGRYIRQTIKPLIRIELNRSMPKPPKRRYTMKVLASIDPYDPWSW